MDVFVVKSGVPCFSFNFANFKKKKKTNKNGNVFFSLFPFDFVSFQSDYSPDLTDNDLVTPLYDFDNSTYHAREKDEEDWDLLELARSLKQEEKVIQPHEERFKIVTPSSAEVRKRKAEVVSEASQEQNGGPFERAS